MQHTTPLAQKAHRFAAIEDVSDQIFDEIIPSDEPERHCESGPNRVRTRLLGLADYLRDTAKSGHEKRALIATRDPSEQAAPPQPASAKDQLTFGWLVIVSGPGRGRSFAVSKDVTCIGRGNDQDVVLGFGDEFISRTAHVTLHFDTERGLVAVRCGEKRNPVLLNGKQLSGTRLLKHKSLITLGHTTLRFVAIDDQQSFWSV